jgi:hypothetical protein
VSEQHLIAQAAAPEGLGGAETGASRENEQTRTESDVRQSEMEITGLVRGRTTAHWTMAGALGIDKRDPVPPVQEGMSFVMDEKPAVFDYACYVTTVKNGKQREHKAKSRGFQDVVMKLLRVKT